MASLEDAGCLWGCALYDMWTGKGRQELGSGRCSVFPAPNVAVGPMFEVPARFAGSHGTSEIGSTATIRSGRTRRPSPERPPRPEIRRNEPRTGHGRPPAHIL